MERLTIAQAETNRQELETAMKCGVLRVSNEKTRRAIEKPIETLMRPWAGMKTDEQGGKQVEINIYGKGKTWVPVSKDVL